jgi:hypothetical protein
MASRRLRVPVALLAGVLAAGSAHVRAQEAGEGNAIADPADLAFEQGRWQDAIFQYREILAARLLERGERVVVALQRALTIA